MGQSSTVLWYNKYMSFAASSGAAERLLKLSSQIATKFFLAVFFTLALLVALTPTHVGTQERVVGDWVQFTLTGRACMPRWGASSVLDAENVLRPSRYGAEKALDRDPATAWVEGAPGAGIGESYYLGLEHLPEALGFINGYAQNTNLFHRNHRVKEVRLHVYAGLMVDGYATEIAEFYDSRPLGDPVTIRVDDTMHAQRISLPVDLPLIRSRMAEFRQSPDVREWNFPQAEEMGLDGSANLQLQFRYIVKLEIADIYPGSTWQDTCIAELWPDYGEATAVTVAPDMRSLLLAKDTGEQIPTCADINYVITIIETSPDNEWALVLQEPAYLEAGERATSSYTVLHTATGWDIGPELFRDGPQPGGGLLPTGFVQEDGRTYLEYENLSTGLNAGTRARVLCTLY